VDVSGRQLWLGSDDLIREHPLLGPANHVLNPDTGPCDTRASAANPRRDLDVLGRFHVFYFNSTSSVGPMRLSKKNE
jgi:hypothetical protein